MIGQLLFGSLGLVMGLIVYGLLWLRFLRRGGRKPETDDILEYGPAVLGAGLAMFIMIGMARRRGYRAHGGVGCRQRAGGRDPPVPGAAVGLAGRRGTL